jgi:hypothetical protein
MFKCKKDNTDNDYTDGYRIDFNTEYEIMEHDITIKLKSGDKIKTKIESKIECHAFGLEVYDADETLLHILDYRFTKINNEYINTKEILSLSVDRSKKKYNIYCYEYKDGKLYTKTKFNPSNFIVDLDQLRDLKEKYGRIYD